MHKVSFIVQLVMKYSQDPFQTLPLCAEIYKKRNYLKALNRIKLLSKNGFADHRVQVSYFTNEGINGGITCPQ